MWRSIVWVMLAEPLRDRVGLSGIVWEMKDHSSKTMLELNIFITWLLYHGWQKHYRQIKHIQCLLLDCRCRSGNLGIFLHYITYIPNPAFRKIHKAGIPDIRNSENPEIQISGIAEFRRHGIPEIRTSGFSDFRSTGMHRMYNLSTFPIPASIDFNWSWKASISGSSDALGNCKAPRNIETPSFGDPQVVLRTLRENT